MKRKLLLIMFVTLCLKISSQNAFITKWGTIGDNEKIQILVYPGTSGYSYTIDWGDGTIETNQTSSAEHTYNIKGDYDVSITGDYPRINLKNQNRLKEVVQWGTIKWTNMSEAFNNSKNFIITATDAPDLSQVTDMSFMFYKAFKLTDGLSNWNVSNVTNMNNLFGWATSFNGNLSNWNVGNVSEMDEMFYNADSFNGDISNWDVSKVTTMRGMFAFTDIFNSSIADWNTTNVTNMSQMFLGAKLFNKSINLWNVSNVTNFSEMFRDADSFNQNLNSWVLSNAENFELMFNSTLAFNGDISNWDVSNVTHMLGLFSGAEAFNQDISNWNVSNVTVMAQMFQNASEFNQDINNWDVRSVVTMANMFQKASKFNKSISNWNVSKTSNMSSMFEYASSFNQDISNWNVTSVLDMTAMFRGAVSFNQNIGDWNISNCKFMGYMFYGVKLSTDNYDKILKEWDKLSVISGVGFHGGSSNFCVSEEERNSLIAKGWTNLSDGGKDCSLSTLSIESFLVDAFDVFPNPIVEYLEIKANNSITINSIQIFDLKGQLIKTSKKNRINLLKLNPGTYVVLMNSNKGSYSKKIIKINK